MSARRLPPELLLAIFIEIQQTHFWTGREKEPPCLAISQVCRGWRTIALNASCLWSGVPLKSARWAKACLDRSRSNCLEVAAMSLITARDHIQRRCLSHVYPELPRVGLFQFHTDTNHDGFIELLREVFTGLSLRPAPKLREMVISITSGRDTNRPPLPLPTTLFASQKLHSLESIILRACNISPSWSRTFITPTLRSLALIDSPAWRTVDEMVDFFRLVLNLEFIHLESVATDSRIFTSSLVSQLPHRAVSLSKLKSFRVSTRYMEELVMFSYLAMPPTADLEVNTGVFDNDLQHMNEEMLALALRRGTEALQDHFAPAFDAGHGYIHVGIDSLGIEVPCVCDHALDSASSIHDWEDFAADPDELAPIAITFSPQSHKRRLMQQSYAMLLEQPILETAATACIRGSLPQLAWSCFKRWVGVETLEISKFNGRTALSGFAAGMHRLGFRLFPELRNLHIVGAIVIEPDSKLALGGEDLAGEGLHGTSAQEFIAAMEELAEYEYFERVTFVRCIVSPRALQAVKDILGIHRVAGDVQTPEEKVRAREEDLRANGLEYIGDNYCFYDDD